MHKEIENTMKKMIPLTKQSKARQREYYAMKRGSWNGVNPVSRVVPNGKRYDRNRSKQDDRRKCVQYENVFGLFLH